jgi:hypothetical protein
MTVVDAAASVNEAYCNDTAASALGSVSSIRGILARTYTITATVSGKETRAASR